MNPLETRFDCYELNDMTLRILLEFWSENLEIWNEFRPEFYYLPLKIIFRYLYACDFIFIIIIKATRI